VCGGQILSDPARVAVASDGRIRGSFPATGWLRSWGSSPLQRLAPAHAPERVSARSRIRGSRRCSDEPCPAANGVTRALCWPCWPFPAVRHAPFEDFPSSTAVSPHDDRCLPAVAVPPSPRPQPKLRSDTVVRPPDPGLAMLEDQLASPGLARIARRRPLLCHFLQRERQGVAPVTPSVTPLSLSSASDHPAKDGVGRLPGDGRSLHPPSLTWRLGCPKCPCVLDTMRWSLHACP
jgi:hypothetical protein